MAATIFHFHKDEGPRAAYPSHFVTFVLCLRSRRNVGSGCFCMKAGPSPEIYIGSANQSGTPELALLTDYLLLHVCEGNDYDACN